MPPLEMIDAVELRHRALPPRNVSGVAGLGRFDHDDRTVAARPRAGAADANRRGNGSESAHFNRCA